MSETGEYLGLFARFPFTLRKFPRERLTLENASRIVAERIERREEQFLDLARRAIYEQPNSPYLALLKMAQCTFPDLSALVKAQGLEGALQALRVEGVYVTFEEFKGRLPIVRNGLTINVRASDFDNPLVERDFTIQTGGSTGAANAVGISLDHVVERVPNEMLALEAYDLLGAPSALWMYMLPSGAPWRRMLTLATLGQPIQKWFCPTGLRDSKDWLKYDLATFYILGWMRLQGFPVKRPDLIKPDKAGVIAEWMQSSLKTEPRLLMYAGVSRALRICVAAHEQGFDLTGAVFRGGGEPATRAKVNLMERVGAKFRPTYAMSETNYVAAACAQAKDPSDVHVLRDAFAIFAHPYHVEALGAEVPALNLTTLLTSVPKLALNVQMDDYGILEERACGCPLHARGYTTHLREIHSYSKLVGEGVTLIGSEMLRLLEEVLPQRFGGTPLDYQLVEQEDAQGLSRVNLLISPRIDIADEQEVLSVVYQALRDSSPMADAARTVWQQAQTIQIQRREPIPTARGKLVPLKLRQPTN